MTHARRGDGWRPHDSLRLVRLLTLLHDDHAAIGWKLIALLLVFLAGALVGGWR